MSQGDVIGLILSGGQATRLGNVRKATLFVGGRRLLDRVTESLQPQVCRILLATGQHDPKFFAGQDTVEAIPDGIFHGHGPISGIAAAVSTLHERGESAEFLLTVAADTPFFPTDFVRRACALLEAHGHQAAVGAYGGQVYPTNALWRLSDLQTLPTALQAGTLMPGIKALLRSTDHVLVDYSDIAHDPFSNVNTLTDLLELNRRAGAPSAGTPL